MKKKLCYLLVCVMLLSFAAGCGKTNQEGNSGTENTQDKTATKPLVNISMMVRSNPSWPYKEDWWIWKTLQEKTNVKLDITAIPDANYTEKFNVAIASQELPDIITELSNASANKNGALGAYADIKQYLKNMPNLSKWIEKYPSEYKNCFSADGKVYIFPNEGMGETNRRSWLYREDVFKKNNIKVPANNDELYQALAKLKQLYPDSYPLTFRSALGNIGMMASQWNTGDNYYYDESKKEWRFGPIESGYKEMLTFFNKLYKEKLIPPDFLTLSTKQWQDIVSTNNAFVTFDYIIRIDFFNNAMQKDNPEFNMAYMAPPAGKNGKSIAKFSSELEQATCVNSRSKNIDRAMDFMDYLYSEDGYNTVSWGKEGETFKVENGQKKFINVKEVADIRSIYGISTIGTYQWYDYSAHMSTYSKGLSDAITASKKTDDVRDPVLAFTEAENDIIANEGESVKKAVNENLSKFILGTRSLDEWDKYVEEINKLGLSKVLDTYKKAQDRLNQAK